MVLLRRASAIAIWIVAITSLAVAGEKSYKLKVDGMHCKMCVYKVTKALEGLPEVKEAVVDLEGGAAVIRLNDGMDITYDSLRQAVYDSGYILNSVEAVTNSVVP